MKIISKRSVIYNLFNRRRATTFSSFVTGINLFVGVFILIYIVVVQEYQTNKFGSNRSETNIEVLQINSGSQSINSMRRQDLRRLSSNDYYLRFDYIIEKAVCQPVNVFYTKNAMDAIQTMTITELNGVLNGYSKVSLKILRINGILKSNERLQQATVNETEKIICSYNLELFVLLKFSSFCNNECQKEQINLITLNKKLFGDLPNSSLKFSLPDISLPDQLMIFQIYNVDIYQTIKYLEKSVFIQSFAEKHFISTKYYHLSENQTFVPLSIKDKSLFIIKKGLTILDSSSIYISFLSLSSPDHYLRHENGKIKLSPNDQSDLFKQDATFKLIFDYKNDLFTLQTINLPEVFFVAFNNDDIQPFLILLPAQQQQQQTNIDKLDRQFIFKLITVS